MSVRTMNIRRLVGGVRAGRAGEAAPLMGSFYVHLRVGLHHEIYSPSQVSHNAKDLMEQAKDQLVLITDGDSTLALESWHTWDVKHRTKLLLEGLIPKQAKGVDDLRHVVTDLSATSDFTDEVFGVFETGVKQPSPDFTATDVHRISRTVLDGARDHPVFVNHRNDLLTFDLLERLEFQESVTTIVHDILDFQVTRELGAGRPAVEWARGTPYAWVAALPDAEIEQFASDLMPYLLESVRRGSLDGFLGNLDSWQTAAKVHGSARFREALATVRGAEEPIEILRPETES